MTNDSRQPNVAPVAEPADQLLTEARAVLQRGDFAGAQQLAERALKKSVQLPQKTDALYTLAVSLRYQQAFPRAFKALESLRSEDPGHARAWQETGHNHLTLDQHDQALAAYEQAVGLNPTLLASWKALTNLYSSAGDQERAVYAGGRVEALSRLPPQLLTAAGSLHEGDVTRADQLCRHFLRTHQHHVEGLRLLGEIGVRQGLLDDAEFILESCVELAPDHDAVRFDYANVLLKRQKFQKAHEQALHLIGHNPDDPATKSLLASAKSGIGQVQQAIALFDEVLEVSPRQTAVMVMKGHAQKTIGQVKEAIESYRQAYAIDPDHGDAFWSLANTKIYQFTESEVDHMREHESASSISESNRIHMCFALGKALEDAQQYQVSINYYSRGNDLKRRSVSHRPEQLVKRVQAQRKICTKSLFSQHAGAGCASAAPIFIVGLPRSGSTLLEQILASHSQVDGTLELPHVLSLVNRLRRRTGAEAGMTGGYPAILATLDRGYFERFGDQYIEETRIFRGTAPHFIDKMPNNFFHVGLIKLILPNAKIIDARRHPMACCFSGFKQLFGEGQEFTYGLTEIGNYYRQYVDLMSHWEDVLPGFVLRVQHEDVVDDLESQVRRLLSFCDLPYEEACLNFHQTDRSVRTPSSEQVRQPIYRSALEHWQNFEPWLEPLKNALGEEILDLYGVS